MLFDSNAVIYSAKPENQSLRELIAKNAPAVSMISRVKVLGYHRLTETQKEYFEKFFKITPLLPVTEEIILKAIALRQQKKMSLGDALIAATALVHDLTLVTHNVKDFEWIDDLSVLSPFEQQ
jgi:predicted nucleic acid-binding protein